MKLAFKKAAAALSVAVIGVAAHSEGKLAIYHWFEYMPQSLLDKFSAEYNVEIVLDTYDSNEALLANLKAGSMGTYAAPALRMPSIPMIISRLLSIHSATNVSGFMLVLD